MSDQRSTCQMLKASLPKFLFEFVGTMFLTMFFISHSQPVILSALTILTIFTWKISRSHFNPAITLAHMIRKGDKKMPVVLGGFYIIS